METIGYFASMSPRDGHWQHRSSLLQETKGYTRQRTSEERVGSGPDCERKFAEQAALLAVGGRLVHEEGPGQHEEKVETVPGIHKCLEAAVRAYAED